MSNITKFLISIMATLSAGAIGSFATAPAIPTWYRGLEKPGFNPPSWVFGPVWTALYILIGISFYLIWSSVSFKKHKRALILFIIQLVLNTGWSLVFFGLQQPFWALIEITVLWVAILLTTVEFFKINKKAGLILLPYTLWVTFAAVLNFSIWQLN